MTFSRINEPILLAHGLLGYDRVPLGPFGWDYFRGVRHRLEAAGNRVLVPQVSPTGGIVTRAQQLKRFLDRHALGQSVHIIAHSMGGLDSRYLITHLLEPGRVRSLTTIGTPHQGSTFAEWTLRRLEWAAKPLFQMLRIPYLGFLDLTPEACARFNERTPNVPGVRYYSVAGQCNGGWLTPLWWLPHRVVADAEGDNDGVVSIRSATYGEATDVWTGDHLSLINAPNLGAQLRGVWIDRLGQYAALVNRLSNRSN